MCGCAAIDDQTNRDLNERAQTHGVPRPQILGMTTNDQLEDTISDIVALIGRVVLLAPRERQEMLWTHVVHELDATMMELLVGESPKH